MCLLTLLTYSIPSQRWHDVALHLFALQHETVVRQRRQISNYEHLENVNVINTNQIPSNGHWQELRALKAEMDWGEMEVAKKEREWVSEWIKEEKVASLCPRNLSWHALEYIAHSFSSLADGGGVLLIQSKERAEWKHLHGEKMGPSSQHKWNSTHEMFDLVAWKQRGFRGHICLCVIENVISLPVERESEPFVMVTSDLGCRNYVSSPLG